MLRVDRSSTDFVIHKFKFSFDFIFLIFDLEIMVVSVGYICNINDLPLSRISNSFG